MPDFAVVTAFRATDHMTGTMKRMTGAVKRFATVMGGLALTMGAGMVVKSFVEFDDAIYGATARFKAAEKEGTDMAVVMDNLRKAARKTGAETQFTAEQAAKGLDKFALAGFTSEEAIMALRSQIDLTTVVGEDFMRVADISSDLLGAFGGAALDATKKIEMLKEMNALLAVGTLSANVTMEDLFETMKMAAPIGTALGMSMKDVIATTSVLGSAGIKGTMAATAMKNIFLRLAAPTKEVKNALGELALSQQDFIDNTGSLKSTAEIFALIGERTKGMSNVKVAGLFKALAGLRGIAGSAVLAKNIGQIREQMIRMGKDPQAAMKETADFMRNSLGNRLKILLSALIEVGYKFVDAFAVQGGDAISGLTDLIGALGPVMSALGKALSIVAKFLPYIIWGFIAYKTAIWGTIIAQKVMIALDWIKYLWMMREFINAVTIKQWLWNIAMNANPIGLIIIGIVALITYVTIAIKNWEDFGAAMMIVLGPLGTLITFIKTLYDRWSAIKAAFSTGGMIAGLKALGAALLEALIKPFQQLWGIIQKVIGFKGAEAPNQSQVNARSGNFQGELNINNAPAGSTIKSKNRGSNIKMNLVGANP